MAAKLNPNAKVFIPGKGFVTINPVPLASTAPAPVAVTPAPAAVTPVAAPVVVAEPAPAQPVEAPQPIETPKAVETPVVEADAKEKDWDEDDATPAAPEAAPAAVTAPAPAAAPAPTPSPTPARATPTKSAPSPAPAASPAPSPAPAAAEADELRKVEEASTSKKPYPSKEHMNIVFIGHVDAGKSTISGQIMLLTGQVDERTIQKYEREAKDKGRDSWWLAYILDTNEEERAKGKTVEVGRAHFQTANKRYTLLDAPGHKNYVPNMIGGAQQADVGVLVISARKGEYETGFERGGQTREHAMLAKTLGIQRLIILINKMDEKTVAWSKERYDQIINGMTPFLKQWGYNVAKEVIFVPASGYTGANLKDPVSEEVCPWYSPRQSLLQVLDGLRPIDRDEQGPLRIPILSRFKDMGQLFALGKIESGTLRKDSQLLLMPNDRKVQCTGILLDEEEFDYAKPGENVCVRLRGVEEEEIQVGSVLCYPDRPARRAVIFDAQLAVVDLLPHKPLVTAGYSCILHVHTVAAECSITALIQEIDKKAAADAPKKRPKFLKQGSSAVVRIQIEESIALEEFKDFPQLGRFTLRDEGKTIAIGKIIKVKQEIARIPGQSK